MRLLLRAGGIAAILALTMLSIGLHRDHLLAIHAQAETYQPFPNCPDGSIVPAGQANPSMQPEPLGAIWCFPLAAPPARTRVIDAWGGWVDTFGAPQMTRFGAVNNQVGVVSGNQYFDYTESLEMDYKIYNDLTTNRNGRSTPLKTQGFINNHHWMFDLGNANIEGGTLISPNKSFRWENGKLVIEADVAAAMAVYGPAGADRFVEIDVNTAAAPTIGKPGTNCGQNVQQGVCWPPDILYGYGDFPGNWSFGCRLESMRDPVCALYNPNGQAGDPNQFGLPNGRVWEMSPTEVGSAWTSWTIPGYNTTGGGLWRQCAVNQMDMFCKERFRLELTATSITLYVNAGKYFQATIKPGVTIQTLPPGQLFPTELISGDNYVYYTTWNSAFNTDPSVRYHWGRVAVNPHDANGNILPPSTSPFYCPPTPADQCGGVGSPTSTPTGTTTGCLLGDINCDGLVDIRDYGLWRQSFGQTTGADLNKDGIVDIRDYGIWRQNFGHTAGAAPNAASAGARPLGTTTPTSLPSRTPASR